MLITKTNKEKSKKGKVLIVNALKEVRQDKNIAFLDKKHIDKIFDSYRTFKDIEGFAKVVSIEEILENKGSLNIAQYLSNVNETDQVSVEDAIEAWNSQGDLLKSSMNELFQTLS